MTHAHPSREAYAVLLLRVSLGVMFIAHCLVLKDDLYAAGTAQFFESLGLPALLAYHVLGRSSSAASCSCSASRAAGSPSP